EVTPGDGPPSARHTAVRVSGYVSPPSLSRASRTGISLFVNRRWVQSRTLTAALEQGYEGMLMTGRRPIAALHIHLPLEDVDVNVHPAKAEVRFRREGEAFAAVRDAVRQALRRQAPVQSVALPAQTTSAPSPATPAHPLAPRDAHARMPSAPPAQPAKPPQAQPLMALPILRPLGQVASTYVIAEGPDGVYLIDQHAAHERVLFERLREQRRRRSVETQGLLEPAPVEVSPAQEQTLQAHREELEAFGFALEPFGERTYLVRSIPAAVQASAPVEALREVLELLGQELPVQREDRVAFSLACHGAIRAGKVLLREEMEELLRLLEQTEQPHTCPHGRPTMVHLSAADLERQFGRR
ncbi:MAG: DNA mismatch repair protein MutL, partial [Chloroflexota bacterium]